MIGRIRTWMLVATLAWPAAWAQSPPPPIATAPSYRGFTPGMSYQDFAIRARQVQQRQSLICNTSRRTAQLMECGVTILDPADSASFYLGAYVLEGRIAQLSFGDSGGVALVERRQRELTDRYGQPRALGYSTWEWRFGPQVVRLNWRARGDRRWIYVALWDDEVLAGISRYVPRKPPG
jgi:hypothetical protein